MHYLIGLDVGIASIGYAILAVNNEDNPIKIIELNSVVFPKAENPKNGASLAAPTRQHRSARRTNRRSKFRKYRVVQLCSLHGLLTSKDKQVFFQKNIVKNNVWQLRVDGLDRKLSNLELFTVLYYFAGHRGFKSNRKYKEVNAENGDGSGDTGAVLNAIQETKNLFEDRQYRTFGEMLLKDDKFKDAKHNKDYASGYLVQPRREWLVDEINQILGKQCELNPLITENFTNEFLKILTSQRDFDRGPAQPSRFGGNLIEKMVGNDTLDPTQKRAAKATYTFSEFNFYQNLNAIQIIDLDSNTQNKLSDEQRKIISEFALNHQTMTYRKVRRLLNLEDSQFFNMVSYVNADKPTLSESHEKLVDFKAVDQIKKCFGRSISNMKIDEIATILTNFSGDNAKREELEKVHDLNLSPEERDSLLDLNFTSHGRLSLKTMRQILPYLRKDKLVYSEAATKAGFDFNKKIIDQNFLMENVTNPVVKRAVAYTLKVVRAIIRKYGKPDSIHLELARDISNSADERKKIEKRQRENRRNNEKIAEELTEIGIPVNGNNILKRHLFDEQGGIDLYSGKLINFEKLFSSEYEIDHIIPYSKSFDDSFTNKTVTTRENNQNKGDRLPLEFISDEDRFKGNVSNIIHNFRKQRHFLKKQITDDDRKRWKTRNLNDTRYLNRILGQYLQKNIDFTNRHKEPVISVNGQSTAKLRQRYGIRKDRELSDLHHAVDAVVIGCMTPAYIQAISHYSSFLETRNDKSYQQLYSNCQNISDKSTLKLFMKKENEVPLPWPEFREELNARLSDNPAELMSHTRFNQYSDEEIKQLKAPFVVRVTSKKATGEAHKETVYSSKKFSSRGLILQRVSVNQLKLDKKGQITGANGIYELEEDHGNGIIYKAIKRELEENDGDGEKAFPDNLLLVNVGSQRIRVTKVKIAKKATLMTPVYKGNGLASNSTMFRIDVYQTSNGLRAVPIYLTDLNKHRLPLKAAVSQKSYANWYQIQSEDRLVVRLQKGDLVRIVRNKNPFKCEDTNGNNFSSNSLFCYFNGFNIATTQVKFLSHDGSFTIKDVNLSTIDNLRKYRITYLGNIFHTHG